MDLRIEIRRNSDGEVSTDVWKDWDYDSYWWEDGNASCDCNREIFFLKARNEKEPEDIKCGENRFSVRISDANSGQVLYDEFTI